MRALTSLGAMVVIVATAVIPACGQQAGGGSHPGAATASDPAGGGSTGGRSAGGGARCGRVAAGPARSITLGASANGRTYCVTPGTGVLVVLHGTVGRRWTPIQVSSGALRRRANGRLILALGVTGAYFVAVHPGRAVISSARPACARPPAASPASSGRLYCDTKLAFRTTVVVTR